MLQVELLHAWVGWATLMSSLALIVQLLIMGDTLPAFHYVSPLLMGILLVVHG